MSASPQIRVRTAETPPLERTPRNAGAGNADDPVELLRNVVSRLKSPGGGLPDKTQLTQLLAEAHEALERANAIAMAISASQECVETGRFEPALQAIDATLALYPDDASLIARRREVVSRRKAFQTAARIRTVKEEAEWFLGQNRPDLALQFLRDKTIELPDDPELRRLLQELKEILPGWQQKRNVQSTLARAATLEQPQQWEAALTVIEEALQSYPESQELIHAAQQLRNRVAEHERRKRLERRLDRIAQAIGAGSWTQARAQLESAQAEFPGTPELEPLSAEIDAGLRRAECEVLVLEVRQCLTDGELEEAGQALARGRKSLGPDPVLEALQQELESDRAYREELRAAQVCFGRRQFEKAEQMLAVLIRGNRPEAETLLAAVRKARAESEEENFFERGREKALGLMQEKQFAQAADLLCNLLSLFPGDPILERELAAARQGIQQEAPKAAAPVPAAKRATQAPAAPIPPLSHQEPAPALSSTAAKTASGRNWTAAIAGTASLLLVSGAGIAWKLKEVKAPNPKPPAITAAAQPQADPPAPVASAPIRVSPAPAPPAASSAEPASAPNSKPAREAASAPAKSSPPPAAQPVRDFVAPPLKRASEQGGNPTLPLPPGVDSVAGPAPARSFPTALTPSGSVPPPPRPAQPATTVVSAPVPEKPPITVGGIVKEAQLLTRTVPVYPETARKRGLVGEVKIQALIDVNGNVTEIKVLSGDAVLAAAAKSAVVKWKYQPGTLNGRPVPTPVSIQIMFGDRK